MEHGQIIDIEQVKILILYTLSQIGKPVPSDKLTDIFLNSGVVDYFTLAQALDSLKETEHIVFDPDEKIVVMTRLGFEASSQLYTQLPSYARERAVNGALDLLKRMELEAGVTAYTDYSNKKYITTCIIKDGEDLLMKLELCMPSMETARATEKKLKAKSADIYGKIMELLS